MDVNPDMSVTAPTRSDPSEARDFLRVLSLDMCGGAELDHYLQEFLAMGQSQCTNVWSKEIIAYRCRTCQLNESSAICVSCFEGGSHWEHDYVMYHSESGGCCDCGDRAAWKVSGFCTAHQRLHLQVAVVKQELLGKTHMVVKLVLKELLACVIKLSEPQSSPEWVDVALVYLSWSQKVCGVDALRNIVCEDIVDQYIHQRDRLTSPLDIFLDYLARMPERIIEAETTLFLQLLYKNEFKDAFSKLLKDKYEVLIVSAINDQTLLDNYEYLDPNLDRVMVQLFNDPDMTTLLIHKYDLLELFIGVFCKIVSSCAGSPQAVINVEHEAIRGKVYLRPQGDLRLILAHGNIAVEMLREQPELFLRIIDVLVNLQWMNPYKPDDDNAEFENSWTLAIQLEMNSMAIIYQLVSRCYQDTSFGKETLVKASTYILKALKRYLKQDFAFVTVSLHIPLHRTLSAILQKIVLLSWDDHEDGFFSGLDFDFTAQEVLDLMDQPLRILVWMTQIRAQIWRKTSEDFSRLELIYRGSFWHDQSMDMDILLLQFCTIAREDMQEKIFIRIAERFDLKNMVVSPVVPDGSRSRRQYQIALLQDFMRLILLVVRERRNVGPKDDNDAQDKCLQYDVIQWLCVRDQTYSQLCRALSAIPMDHKRLNAMLEKVAIYHEPKVAERGYYQLKPEYWNEFDPLFAHYFLSELEEAEDRAVKVGKLEHYWRITAPPPAAAPYNRLSNLLHTKACHLFLMNVLNEVRHLVKLNTSATAGEALGVTALQMMAVLLSDSHNKTRHAPSKPSLSVGPQDGYSSDDIFVNICVKLRMQSVLYPSIHDMLVQLQRENHCTRLVDSVNYVLELLSPSTSEKPFVAEVDILAAEDVQRRLRKEQRQKAILEEFAAKRKAFLEYHDVSDDDGSPMDVSHTEAPISDGTSGSTGGMISSSEKLTEDGVPVLETDCASMDTVDKARECVLCRSKRDVDNSSLCWIALVQQYNFPILVLSRGEAVESVDDKEVFPSTGQVHGENLSEVGSKQLVTVLPSESEGFTGSCIDCVTAEHVQCCGHQMHLHCFQGHVNALQASHSSGSGYAGKGIVDLSKVEFLCPICRRLANVLLPDVDASISSKMLQMQEDVNGGVETRKDWNRFWQSNKNLETAIDFYATQAVRVRNESFQHGSVTSSFINCKALWEGLALNIVHCEVETREGPVQEDAASSSSAPTQLFDERNWDGDSAHWTALRELGKLAMLSNTLPGTEQEKGQLLGTLRRSLGLLNGRETLHKLGASELENIVQQMFSSNLQELVQPLESVQLAYISPETSPCEVEVTLAQQSPEIFNCDEAMEERKERQLGDRKLGVAHQGVPVASGTKQKGTVDPPLSISQGTTDILLDRTSKSLEKMEDACASSEQTLGPQECTPSSPATFQEKENDWSSNILKNGVLGADPFGLLMVFFMTFKGRPKRKVMRMMVEFAYTVAVLQTQKAVTSLGVVDSEVERDLIQRACLPFLRRAALLVQIITREDFKGQYTTPGTKVMDFLYLQQALQLPDCTEIIRHKTQGTNGTMTLASTLQHLNCPMFVPKLYRVPRKVLLHKLPWRFQELLLENIQKEKVCDICKEIPRDPAICLLCGKFLCCNKPGGAGECSKHAATESAGVGIFLLLRSTQLLLLRKNRSCMGLSLYLDAHGEEDLYLRRNELLYLSDLRLNEVRRLWMTAAFDYDSYILRNSQTRPPL